MSRSPGAATAAGASAARAQANSAVEMMVESLRMVKASWVLGPRRPVRPRPGPCRGIAFAPKDSAGVLELPEHRQESMRPFTTCLRTQELRAASSIIEKWMSLVASSASRSVGKQPRTPSKERSRCVRCDDDRRTVDEMSRQSRPAGSARVAALDAASVREQSSWPGPVTPDSQRPRASSTAPSAARSGATQLSQFADPPQRMISKLAAGPATPCCGGSFVLSSQGCMYSACAMNSAATAAANE